MEIPKIINFSNRYKIDFSLFRCKSFYCVIDNNKIITSQVKTGYSSFVYSIIKECINQLVDIDLYCFSSKLKFISNWPADAIENINYVNKQLKLFETIEQLSELDCDEVSEKYYPKYFEFKYDTFIGHDKTNVRLIMYNSHNTKTIYPLFFDINHSICCTKSQTLYLNNSNEFDEPWSIEIVLK